MALDANTIITGINNAGFTADEWTNAMKVLKLQVQLGLKRSEIANKQAWFNAQVLVYNGQLDALNQQEADIVTAINGLAPDSQ